MSNPKQFVRVRFPSSPSDSTLQGMLIRHDPLGFLEEDHWWEAYFDAEHWPAIEEEFRTRLEAEGYTSAYELETFDQRNWNKDWEESIEPIRVSDRFLITPSWHHVTAEDGTTVLVIDPKMSFGTGYHATTRLMLRLLEPSLRQDDHVLDVGSGTGVLGIAAVTIGAASAVGVDTDEWSYDNAVENAQRNGVADRCTFHLGTIDQADGTFDLILSNITKLDNLELLPEFLRRLGPDGRIVLSGFYSDDAEEMVLGIERTGLRVTARLSEDEWCAIVAERDGK